MAEMTAATDFAKAVHLFPLQWVDGGFGAVMRGPNPGAVIFREADRLTIAFRAIRGDGRVVTGSAPARVGAPLLSEDRRTIHQWGLQRIGSGVWVVSPSIATLEVHAFIVIYGAPESVSSPLEWW